MESVAKAGRREAGSEHSGSSRLDLRVEALESDASRGSCESPDDGLLFLVPGHLPCARFSCQGLNIGDASPETLCGQCA